jgi:hypothetical protein
MVRRAIISAALSHAGVDSARRNVFSSAPVLIWTGHGIARTCGVSILRIGPAVFRWNVAV